MMIHIERFVSTRPGPKVLVFGAIHGDEISGPIVIQRCIDKLKSKAIVLEKGELSFVPICNPKAYAQNTRGFEENLNRVFKIHENPEKYEQKLANILAPLVAQHDILLDLHSFQSKGESFVFQDFNGEKEERLAKSVAIKRIFLEWGQVYNKKPKMQSDDTNRFAFNNGVAAVTVEAGNHNDPQSIEVAYQSILNVLNSNNMISGETGPVITPPDFERIRVEEIIVKEKEGELAKEWEHMSPVKKGTILAHYADGEKIIAPYDSLILLPKKNALLKTEWFYRGRLMER